MREDIYLSDYINTCCENTDIYQKITLIGATRHFLQEKKVTLMKDIAEKEELKQKEKKLNDNINECKETV